MNEFGDVCCASFYLQCIIHLVNLSIRCKGILVQLSTCDPHYFFFLFLSLLRPQPCSILNTSPLDPPSSPISCTATYSKSTAVNSGNCTSSLAATHSLETSRWNLLFVDENTQISSCTPSSHCGIPRKRTQYDMVWKHGFGVYYLNLIHAFLFPIFEILLYLISIAICQL